MCARSACGRASTSSVTAIACFSTARRENAGLQRPAAAMPHMAVLGVEFRTPEAWEETCSVARAAARAGSINSARSRPKSRSSASERWIEAMSDQCPDTSSFNG